MGISDIHGRDMITVLFISDDKRTVEQIARFQPHFRARLRLASDFDQGLKEVFDNRPAAVFIQSDISGISGETVARHIKTLLRTDAPRIILIHTAPIRSQVGKRWYDDTLDLSLPDQDLDEHLRERLVAVAPGQWIEVAPPPSVPIVEEPVPLPVEKPLPASAPAEEFAFHDWDIPGTVSAQPESTHRADIPPSFEIEEYRPLELLAPDTPERLVTPGREGGQAAGKSCNATPGLSGMSTQGNPQAPAAASPSPAVTDSPINSSPAASPAPADARSHVHARQAAPPAQATTVSSRKEDPFEERPAASIADFSARGSRGSSPEWVSIPSPGDNARRGGQRPSLWAAAVVILVLGIAAGGSFYLSKKPVSPSPAEKGASQAQALATATPTTVAQPQPSVASVAPEPLPSFVPARGKDPAFAKTSPGWERYQGDGAEFRLYREGGRLRAVQVIARNPGGVPKSLVATAVKELTGAGTPKLSKRKDKGEYLVESGSLNGKGELVIYRRKGVIRGFVISLA